MVGEAAAGGDAVRLTGKLDPNVVVMDVAMRRLNGREATRKSTSPPRQQGSHPFRPHNDDEYIARMLEVDAARLLVKQGSVAALTRAIPADRNGGRFFDSFISKRFKKNEAPPHGRTEPPAMRRSA